MTELYLTLSFVAGILLGVFYFGSLWWVVSQLSKTRRPERLLIASFVIRTSLAMAGFYFVMSGRPERLIACLVGFFLTRVLLVRFVQQSWSASNCSRSHETSVPNSHDYKR